MLKPEFKELLKNTGIMLIITIIAGGILGSVNEMTKGPIAVMEEKNIKKANARVFVNADSFSEDILDKDLMSECLGEEYSGVYITEALEAYDLEGNVLGYVFEVTSKEGYGGDIVFRIGLQNDGTTTAIHITQISETAGLGMKAPEVTVPQFVERSAENYELVKSGAVLDTQINAISGATITSKAIVKGVNASLAYFRAISEGGVVNE